MHAWPDTPVLLPPVVSALEVVPSPALVLPSDEPSVPELPTVVSVGSVGAVPSSPGAEDPHPANAASSQQQEEEKRRAGCFMRKLPR
jgi:hypothetical protein